MATIERQVAKVYWNGGDNVESARFATTDNVGGVEVVLLDKTDKRLANFPNNSWATIDALTALRNQAVDRMMESASSSENSAYTQEAPDAVIEQGPPKRARRELFDFIEPITQVDVETDGGLTCNVRAMRSAQHRHKLWIELTQANLSLLMQTPKAALLPPPTPE
eukprot:7549358-Pyramimonas_sp.AAC.1